MRGSTPYASALTSLHYDPEGDADESALKVDMLLLSEDPEECDAPGARGAVVRSELREFVVKDMDGDGADDVEMDLEYLFAPAPSKTACWGKEGLKATKVVLLRNKSGFSPRRSDVPLATTPWTFSGPTRSKAKLRARRAGCGSSIAPPATHKMPASASRAAARAPPSTRASCSSSSDSVKRATRRSVTRT
jgi:hypothetical protein